MTGPRPAVFLDRDGVLNRTTVRDGTPYPPTTRRRGRDPAGRGGRAAGLRERGLPLIVVTNQPDVARGTQTREAVEQINQLLARPAGRSMRLYICYHDNADDCDCRKPRPGMLLRGRAGARHRPAAQLHGRRPLERRRRRRGGGVHERC